VDHIGYADDFHKDEEEVEVSFNTVNPQFREYGSLTVMYT